MLSGVLRGRIRAGDFLVGVIPAQPSADLVEVCGLLGFDFAFVDAEHGILSVETCRDMIRAADAVNLPVLVRVPRNDAVVMLPYLEAGAAGVIVPHVRSASDAQAAVDAVKYYPAGARGAGSSTRANAHGLGRSAAEYFRWANDQTIVVPMIEDPDAIENLASIGQVPGVDLLFIGPGDLALALGHGGEGGHAEVRSALDHAFRTARSAGIRVGTVGYTREKAQEAIDAGAQLIVHSTNLLLASSAKEFLTAVRTPESKLAGARA